MRLDMSSYAADDGVLDPQHLHMHVHEDGIEKGEQETAESNKREQVCEQPSSRCRRQLAVVLKVSLWNEE